MSREISMAILQFLERVNLIGKEVPVYTACIAELQKIIKEESKLGE